MPGGPASRMILCRGRRSGRARCFDFDPPDGLDALLLVRPTGGMDVLVDSWISGGLKGHLGVVYWRSRYS